MDKRIKKKRFRLTEQERTKCALELFNILSEDGCQCEEEIWQYLHRILCYDKQSRFKNCTIRLLKEHMTEQVRKFQQNLCKDSNRNGSSEPPTTTHSAWVENMQKLLTVWETYERITKKGKEQKDKVKYSKTNEKNYELQTPTPQLITDNATKLVIESESEYSSSCNDIPNNNNNNNNNNGETRRIEQSLYSNKKRQREDSAVFAYLTEKLKIEKELKDNELKLQEAIHQDSIALQREEIKYKKAKLEFEMEQWKCRREERLLDQRKNEAIISLLEMFIKK